MQIEPGAVDGAIYAAVKVFSCRSDSILIVFWISDICMCWEIYLLTSPGQVQLCVI
jgi:hypothetical protein